VEENTEKMCLIVSYQHNGGQQQQRQKQQDFDDDDDRNKLVQSISLLFMCWRNHKISYRASTRT